MSLVDRLRRRKLGIQLYYRKNLVDATKPEQLCGCTGRIGTSSGWVFRPSKWFKSVPIQLRQLLKASIALTLGAQRCVFLGFTRGGAAVISYSIGHQLDDGDRSEPPQAQFLDPLASSAALECRLQIWSFRSGWPLVLLQDVRILCSADLGALRQEWAADGARGNRARHLFLSQSVAAHLRVQVWESPCGSMLLVHARDRAACATAASRSAVQGFDRPTAAAASGAAARDHRHRSGRQDREGRRSAASAESVALSLWSVVPVAAEPADVWRRLHLAVVGRARPSGSGSGSGKAGHERGPRRTPDVAALRKCGGLLSMHQCAAPPAGAIHSHFEVASPYPRPSLVELAECSGGADTRRFCLSLNTGSSVRMVFFTIDRPLRCSESLHWAGQRRPGQACCPPRSPVHPDGLAGPRASESPTASVSPSSGGSDTTGHSEGSPFARPDSTSSASSARLSTAGMPDQFERTPRGRAWQWDDRGLPMLTSWPLAEAAVRLARSHAIDSMHPGARSTATDSPQQSLVVSPTQNPFGTVCPWSRRHGALSHESLAGVRSTARRRRTGRGARGWPGYGPNGSSGFASPSSTLYESRSTAAQRSGGLVPSRGPPLGGCNDACLEHDGEWEHVRQELESAGRGIDGAGHGLGPVQAQVGRGALPLAHRATRTNELVIDVEEMLRLVLASYGASLLDYDVRVLRTVVSGQPARQDGEAGSHAGVDTRPDVYELRLVVVVDAWTQASASTRSTDVPLAPGSGIVVSVAARKALGALLLRKHPGNKNDSKQSGHRLAHDRALAVAGLGSTRVSGAGSGGRGVLPRPAHRGGGSGGYGSQSRAGRRAGGGERRRVSEFDAVVSQSVGVTSRGTRRGADSEVAQDAAFAVGTADSSGCNTTQGAFAAPGGIGRKVRFGLRAVFRCSLPGMLGEAGGGGSLFVQGGIQLPAGSAERMLASVASQAAQAARRRQPPLRWQRRSLELTNESVLAGKSLTALVAPRAPVALVLG